MRVQIDRPLRTRHPQHGLIYPVIYDSVPGPIAADGAPIDVYVLGAFEPLKEFTAARRGPHHTWLAAIGAGALIGLLLAILWPRIKSWNHTRRNRNELGRTIQ